MIDYPTLDFGKTKVKYPNSGIYLHGKKVSLPTFSFFRCEDGISVKMYVPTGDGLVVNDGDIVDGELKLKDAFYGAIVDDELINIEDWVLEFGVVYD